MPIYRIWIKYQGLWQHQNSQNNMASALVSANTYIAIKGVSATHIHFEPDGDIGKLPQKPKHLVDEAPMG